LFALGNMSFSLFDSRTDYPGFVIWFTDFGSAYVPCWT